MPSPTITFRVPQRLCGAIRATAQTKGVSVSELLRVAIAAGLDRRAASTDRAADTAPKEAA